MFSGGMWNCCDKQSLTLEAYRTSGKLINEVLGFFISKLGLQDNQKDKNRRCTQINADKYK
jgi:hypothetical protein